MNAAGQSLGCLVAHQLHQDKIVAVHREYGIDSAVGASAHDLVRLLSILRDVGTCFRKVKIGLQDIG